VANETSGALSRESVGDLLRLSSVSLSFGGLGVIDQLDLAVGKGEVLGVIGPNGVGKSTLFNLIGGVLAPTSGRIFYRGNELKRMPPWKRSHLGIGRTYQIPRPFTHMSVFENVLVAAVHGAGVSIKEGKSVAEDVLDRTGLLHRHADFAGTLSLLDLKRLELSKAMAQRPELILLDEIAGGLTEAECDLLLEVVRRIHSQGATVIWIEHVIHALRRIATRLAVLFGGSILAIGSPDDVLANEHVRNVYLGA
jgi:branched-chain amino acid transport system ATP-binding protein